MRTLPLSLFLLMSLVALPASPGYPSSVGPVGTVGVGPSGSVAGPLQVEAEEIAYDTAANTVTARGNVRITHPRFRLFADLVTVDLGAQLVTAEGRVRLIDAQGRELRGRRLVYDLVREEATATNAETIVESVYVKAGQVVAGRDRLTVQDASLTTCDPARPLYRVTARRVEILLGEEVVAYGASVWLGSVRLFRVGVYRISLRETKGPPLPSIGSNSTDGLWIDYRYPYELGDLQGEFYAKYGQHSGLFGLNTLTYDRPAWGLTLALGRTQERDPDDILRAFTEAELAGAVKPWRLPGLPLSVSGRAAFGWFAGDAALAPTTLSTTRLDATVTLAADTLSLGPQTSLAASAAYRFSAYGSGAQRTILSAGVALTHRFDEATTATVRYDLASIQGATPFLFDRVDPDSTVALSVAHTRPAYRFSAGVAHNFVIPETTLSAGAGYRVSPSFFVDVSAVYNLRTQAFEDIDYTVTYTCDCLNVAVRYRQVRQEISVQFLFTVSDRLALSPPPPQAP